MTMRRWSAARLWVHAVALVALLAVFALYLRPGFMAEIAQLVWSCF